MSSLNLIYTLIMKWVFPNHCISCNEKLDEGILCNPCINQLEPTDGRDRLSEIFFPENIDKAFACWWFTDTLQEVIHHLKYSDRARVGKVLGQMAAVHLDNSAISTLDILTAIPLHPKKRKENGVITRHCGSEKDYQNRQASLLMHPLFIGKNIPFHKQRCIGKNVFKIWKMHL